MVWWAVSGCWAAQGGGNLSVVPAGQTVFHDPPHSTLQLGDPSTVAVRTGIPTIGDFRVADVAAGGQGAPLTSTMDVLCLAPPVEADVTLWRAVQNIGVYDCCVR